MDMTGYFKISCLDNFSWICSQFISCFSKDILLYPSVSLHILSYLMISVGANSQMLVVMIKLERTEVVKWWGWSVLKNWDVDVQRDFYT